MGKKAIYILLILVILISSIGIHLVYAKTSSIKLLYLDNTEVAINSKFDLKIDLSKITFKKFKIELSSNIKLDKPVMENDDLDIIIDDDNLLEITASKSNLNYLNLNYTIPDNIEIGTVIEFKVIVTLLDIEQDNGTADSNNINEIDNSMITLEDSISLKVIEEIIEKNDEDNDNKDDKHANNMPNELNNNDKNNVNNTIQKSSKDNNQNFSVLTNVQVAKSSNNNSNIKSNTVVYNGSCNNYLSSLSVSTYSLSTDFCKTNNSYFITVPLYVTSVDVTAIPEDDNSTVCIYGNSNLNSGTNKILISVTAENGNVRTYRIYVTKQ